MDLPSKGTWKCVLKTCILMMNLKVLVCFSLLHLIADKYYF